MFEAWACERPVILSAAGEAVKVLEQAGAGIAVPPEDPAAIACAVEQLAADRPQAEAMGKRGRTFVEAHYSRQEQAQRLERVLSSEFSL
jgi:glycosyltransferase involved in cell wall biosynthesis